MKKQYKKDPSLVQLERTIRLVHSKSGQYKTILPTSDIMYQVVTRVNYMTANLWITHFNSLVNEKEKHITKVNWMVIMKSYRRQRDLDLEYKN